MPLSTDAMYHRNSCKTILKDNEQKNNNNKETNKKKEDNCHKHQQEKKEECRSGAREPSWPPPL